MSGRVGELPSRPVQSIVSTPPPHSIEAEEAVLGGILLSKSVLPAMLDEGLRGHHFYRERHQRIFEAAVAVTDRGLEPDVVTVTEQLRDRGILDTIGGPAAVDALTASVPGLGNARGYAQAVIEAHTWRARLAASHEIQAAVADRDEDRYLTGEAALHLPRDHGKQRSFDPMELALATAKRLEGRQVEAFPWPFPRLNKLTRGGMRRGQVTVLSGPTRHGKSVMLDMSLESAAGPGRRVGLFINEMGAEERALRVVARRATISHERLELASAGLVQLNDVEMHRALNALDDLPFGMVECAGWTATEICREARRQHLDVVGVDIIQRLPHRNQSRVRDLEEASNEFDRLAKETGCHVLICAHTNRSRTGYSPVVPFPALNDIRDCAQLANDADNVLFVWREQDEDTGDPLPNGIVRFGKVRGGTEGGLDVKLDGDHMTFDPRLVVAGEEKAA